jgi:phosphomannomutase
MDRLHPRDFPAGPSPLIITPVRPGPYNRSLGIRITAEGVFMAGVFKSYDIRGIFPDQLDAPLGRKIGVGLARLFRSFPENAGKSRLHLVVGRDMRTSAPEMAAALIDGLTSCGIDVTDIGMVTTPCQYFAIQKLGADGGIACTASHNPPKYIGYKVSRELAIPISHDTGLNQVEAGIEQPGPGGPRGQVKTENVDEAYLDFLLGQAVGIKSLKVAVDASNGMAGKYVERLFQRLGVPMEGIFLPPDGTFPNHEADPLKPENLKYVSELVRRTGADVGFCFDGDGDRVAVVDETGEMIGCDLVTALLCRDALSRAPGSICTYDLRSSRSVRDVIKEAGGEPVRIRVGHSHAKQTMRQLGAICGGELSGHYYFKLDGATTFWMDSALVATVRLLNVLSASGKKTSELVAPMKKYFHTGEINFAIDDKDAALATIRQMFADGKQDSMDGTTVEYDDWWFNVRPSNTEPLLRLTLEGNTPALRDKGLDRVLAVLLKFGHRATGGH